MAEDFKLQAAISDECQIYLEGGGTVWEEARKIWELYINRGSLTLFEMCQILYTQPHHE